LRQQLIREGKEPIYQNLPIHERMMIDNSGQDQEEDENEDLNTTNYEKDIADDDIEETRQVIGVGVWSELPFDQFKGQIIQIWPF